MLENNEGNILVIKDENNGHIQLEVHKDIATKVAEEESLLNWQDDMQAAREAGQDFTDPRPEGTHQRMSIYVGQAVEEKKENTTASTEKTFAEMEQELLEEVVLEYFAASYDKFPRTKFEVSTWKTK